MSLTTARVLVTGAAGYIGSFCVRRLQAAGYEVVTVDDLSSGHAAAVDCRLVELDIRDRAALGRLLGEGFDGVLHLAGLIAVGESVVQPRRYLDVNVRGSLTLLDAMREHGVECLVFSSTCAVYGPHHGPLDEQVPLAPSSPYAETKLLVERAIELSREQGLRSYCLRYFNAAGAADDASLGEAHDPETHLIPIAIACAREGRPLTVFGDDYPTPDGTCVRDYVHVLDLAEAHVCALERLLAGAPGEALNLGTGRGASVLEIARLVSRHVGCALELRVGPCRPGDQASLLAAPDRAARSLAWSATRSLDEIIASACAWHRNPRYGRGTARPIS